MTRHLLTAALVTLAISVPATARGPVPPAQLGPPADPAALGYLDLHKRHPDALEGPDEFSGYSTADALERLEQVRGMLGGFYQLTSRTRAHADRERLLDG